MFVVSAATSMHDAATATGIPDYGDAHPSISGLQVVDIDAQPVEGKYSEALVTVTYRRPSASQKADPTDDNATPSRGLAASLVQKIANRDSAGNLVTVTHDGDTQVAQFGVDRPVVVLTFARREKNMPLTRALTYVGKLNSSSWGGLAARTCLMTNIRAESFDDGETWDVSYEVYHDPDGWDIEVFYRLGNGLPADGLTPTVGIKTVQVVGTENFSSLNLV